jgi:hypothetical protein
MRVNSAFKGFFNNRLAVGLAISIVILVFFLVASSFTKRSNRELMAKEANLVIRQIGHQLLLQSGDSSSRVLPVTEITRGSFLLEFENEFVFNHDSLMVLTQRLLPKTRFPSGYTLTVHECRKASIIYGFQVNKTSPDILACSGRSQPAGCYTIEIAFPDLYKTSHEYPLIGLIVTCILVLLSTALLIGRFEKNQVLEFQNQVDLVEKNSVQELPDLGKFIFDVKHQRLLCGSEVIRLTDKECRILGLLNSNFGELISRDTLMQKVWVNEGVITGRSLDMFVSKLRKKLSGDPQLSITNVHGKGYKLELLKTSGEN